MRAGGGGLVSTCGALFLPSFPLPSGRGRGNPARERRPSSRGGCVQDIRERSLAAGSRSRSLLLFSPGGVGQPGEVPPAEGQRLGTACISPAPAGRGDDLGLEPLSPPPPSARGPPQSEAGKRGVIAGVRDAGRGPEPLRGARRDPSGSQRGPSDAQPSSAGAPLAFPFSGGALEWLPGAFFLGRTGVPLGMPWERQEKIRR